MPEDDVQVAALTSISIEVGRLVTERSSLLSLIRQSKAAVAALNCRIAECESAAHFFQGERLTTDSSITPSNGSPRVRDLVLEHLFTVGDVGCRVTSIQKHVHSRYPAQIHPKTVGMTLFRLKTEGLVRRHGHAWRIQIATD